MSAPSGLEPKFRVAICGAGIAGLVLAITIGKYDPSIPIDLYEAHDTIDTAGVGITMWRQTNEVMIELGLFDELQQIITQLPGGNHGPNTRRSDIPEGGYHWFQKVYRHGPSPMHRQHMVAVLEKHLPASCVVHFKKQLVDYIEPEQQDGHSMPPIRLNFANGTTATTDVLIGADGVRSVVRKTMFETASEDNNGDLKQYVEAIFTGMTIHRWLIPAETLREASPGNISLNEISGYAGKGRYLVSYPIAKGTIINVAAVVSEPSLTGTPYGGHWVSEGSREQLVECFNDFEPDARALVKLCEKPSRWALHVVKPLPFCVRSRVALIGDACHATTPHFSAGAGQAIEDAFVLGRLIAHPLTTLRRIPAALCIHEAVRLPLARSVADLSLSTAWMYPFMAPGYYDGTRKEDDLDERGVSAYEREGMETIKQEILRRWDWMDDLSGALHAWKEAASKFRASAR